MEETSYKIINRAGRFLAGFHSNGGWSIGDVFPCSSKMATIFKTEQEARDYLSFMKEDCKKQQIRWNGWGVVAEKFLKTLSITTQSL